MPTLVNPQIRCFHCGKLFPYPDQIGKVKGLLKEALAGKSIKCPHCKKMTTGGVEVTYVSDD